MPTAQIDQGLLCRHAGQHVHNEAFTSMFDNSMQRRLAIQHAVAGPGDAIRDRPNPPPRRRINPPEIRGSAGTAGGSSRSADPPVAGLYKTPELPTILPVLIPGGAGTLKKKKH